jgi:hypothetical protein
MPSARQETRNRWITINFFDKLRSKLNPVPLIKPYVHPLIAIQQAESVARII